MNFETGNRPERKVENVGDYERQKIEVTLRDLELAKNTLKNALIILDFAAEKGIPVADRPSLHTLRHPESVPLAGIDELLRLAQKIQIDAAAKIPVELKSELEQRFVKSDY